MGWSRDDEGETDRPGRRRRSNVTIGVIACAVIGLAACGAESTEPITTGDTATTVSSAPAATTAEPASTDATPSGSSEIGSPENPVWFSDHLEVGDCWNEVWDENDEPDRSEPPEILGCDEPHFQEVYGAWTSADRPYPGEDALGEEANEECGRALVEYMGAEWEELNGIDGFVPKPSEAEWDAGARRMVCVAFFDSGRVAESVEGIGTRAPLPYDMPQDAPIPPEARIFTVGDTEDGDRAANYDLEGDRGEVAARIVAGAAEAGWEVGQPFSAASTTVIEMTNGDDEYTVTISALDDGNPRDLTLVFYYPPGELSSWP